METNFIIYENNTLNVKVKEILDKGKRQFGVAGAFVIDDDKMHKAHIKESKQIIEHFKKYDSVITFDGLSINNVRIDKAVLLGDYLFVIQFVELTGKAKYSIDNEYDIVKGSKYQKIEGMQGIVTKAMKEVETLFGNNINVIGLIYILGDKTTIETSAFWWQSKYKIVTNEVFKDLLTPYVDSYIKNTVIVDVVSKLAIHTVKPTTKADKFLPHKSKLY